MVILTDLVEYTLLYCIYFVEHAYHRRRIELEDQAKVVVVSTVQQFIPNRPAEFNRLRGETASAARILSPQTDGTTFALSSNSILLL